MENDICEASHCLRRLSKAPWHRSQYFGYDPAGRQTSLGLPSGVTATYGYDGGSRLTSIAYNNGPTSVGDLQDSFDETGKRATVPGSLARTGIPQTLSSAGYDPANRLTSWCPGGQLALAG
ncbi:MAG: hypothetical protein ACR2FO_07235 [Actinomycetota bacterium]